MKCRRRDVLLALREANVHPDRIAAIPVFREHLRRYAAGGGDCVARRARAPASSMTSIALSGRNLSVM